MAYLGEIAFFDWGFFWRLPGGRELLLTPGEILASRVLGYYFVIIVHLTPFDHYYQPGDPLGDLPRRPSIFSQKNEIRSARGSLLG
jgi:hypothetical protein